MKVMIYHKEVETLVAKEIDVVTVVLGEATEEVRDHLGQVRREPRLRPFYCNNCQNMLFQYIGQVLAVTPGAAPVSLPMIVQCQNHRCKTKYMVERIVSRNAIIEPKAI